MDVAILHPAQFEEGVLNHVLVDAGFVEFLHLLGYGFLVFQLLNIVDCDEPLVLLIQHVKDRFHIVLRNFYGFPDVRDNSQDAIFQVLVSDVATGVVSEHAEDVGVVEFVGQNFNLFLHFFDLDGEDDGHLLLHFVVGGADRHLRPHLLELLRHVVVLVVGFVIFITPKLLYSSSSLVASLMGANSWSGTSNFTILDRSMVTLCRLWSGGTPG